MYQKPKRETLRVSHPETYSTLRKIYNILEKYKHTDAKLHIVTVFIIAIKCGQKEMPYSRRTAYQYMVFFPLQEYAKTLIGLKVLILKTM